MSKTLDAFFVVESGIPGTDHIPLTTALFVVGKNPDVDFTIDNPFVSRRHCQIRARDNSFYITDLGSKNGTYVNSVRLQGSEEKELNHEDLVGFAEDRVIIRFRHSSSETLTLELPRSPLVTGLHVDSGPREVYLEGALLTPPVSRKEFDVLELLYQRREDAVSRDDIVRVGWPERDDGDVGNQELEQCIRRIRHRIEPDPRKPKYVITVRRYGYKMP